MRGTITRARRTTHGARHGLPEGMNDLLELDAEVLHDYWTAALDWVRERGRAAVTAPGCSTSARAPAPARSAWPSASPTRR